MLPRVRRHTNSELDLQVPAITSVNAKTTDAAIALTPFEITDITGDFQ